MVIPFDLPAIDADAFVVVIDNFFPNLQWHLQKAGHQHYEFVRPLLTVQKLAIFNGEDPCADQQNAFTAAVAKVKSLQDQLNKLLIQLATAPPGQRKAIRAKISDLRINKIPLAQKALDAALLGLRSCRAQVGRGGGISQGARSTTHRRRGPRHAGS